MRRAGTFIMVAALVVSLFGARPDSAWAGTLTALSDVVTKHKVSEYSNHTFRFTSPSGVATGESISITFPAGFNLGSLSYTDIDMSWGPVTGTETEVTLASSPSGTTWGATVSGQIISITSDIGTINANSKIIIEVGTHASTGSGGSVQIQNPGSSTIALITIGGTFADSGKIALAILNDDVIPVTASVDAYLTLALSATSTSFNSLSAASVNTSTPNITLSINTNAAHGYSITLRDVGDGINSGLYNSAINYLIGSADSGFSNSASLSGGTEGYGVQASSATATIASPYNSIGTTVAALKQNATSFASYTTLPTSTHTITVTHKATVAITSAAGLYRDSLIYSISGNF